MSVFSRFLSSLKLALAAASLVIASYFLGRNIGWRKAVRWASIKYEIKQARESLKDVEARNKIKKDINQRDDDELDELLLLNKPKPK